MHTSKWGGVGLAIAVVWASVGASAQQDGVTTLVGRGDKTVVIERDGRRQELEKQDLVLINRSQENPGIPKASAKSTTPDKKTAKASDKNAQEDKASADAAAAQAKKDKAREAQLKREAATKPVVDKLRGIQDVGGWFYDEKDHPLSAEEVKKRLDTGDVKGIKVIDTKQQQWKVVQKPESGSEGK